MQRLGSVELIVRGRRAADAMGVALILAQFWGALLTPHTLSSFHFPSSTRCAQIFTSAHFLVPLSPSVSSRASCATAADAEKIQRRGNIVLSFVLRYLGSKQVFFLSPRRQSSSINRNCDRVVRVRLEKRGNLASCLNSHTSDSQLFGSCFVCGHQMMKADHAGMPMLLVAVIALTHVTISAADTPAPDALSYSLYPAYPKYCSTPEEMATRAIPPLSDSAPQNSQLVHVTAVIRHGARTPWSDNMQCWDGYWDDPATAVWNCELTTMTSPPSPPFIEDVENNPTDSEINNEADASVGDSAMFLFEKRYDALHNPPVLANAFNGTCQMGQLLLRGYEQELANGKHLRDAYVYSESKGAMFKGSSVAADPRMRLFDLDDEAYKSIRPYEEPHLYYRADDEQRTLMSGQVLLRGLFGPEITTDAKATGVDPVIVLHTADYKYDVLGSNWKDCPRLEDLEDDATSSAFFQKFNTSAEAKELYGIAAKLGKDFDRDDWIDCLMTTMCTDRPLPGKLNDFDGQNDKSTFQRFLDFATYASNYKLKHNGAAYAKLGMGPLWHEMMANIRSVVEETEKAAEDGGGVPPKLALFSGHDSTLQPLLASLGENVWDGKLWSPYASSMLIELHNVSGDDPTFKGKTKYMFRIVYNGEAVTSRMDDCPSDSDLCDASVLIDLVTPFATIVDRDCKSSINDNDAYSSVLATEELLTTPGGILIFGSMMILCGFLGSLGTFVYLTGRLPMYCITKSSGVASLGVRRQSGSRESYGGISLPERNGEEKEFDDEEHFTNNGHSNGDRSNLPPANIYGSSSESSRSKAMPKKDIDENELI